MLRRLIAPPPILKAAKADDNPPDPNDKPADDPTIVYLPDAFPQGFRFPSQAEVEAMALPFPAVVFGDAPTPPAQNTLEFVLGILVIALLATALGLFIHFYRKEHWSFLTAHRRGITNATRFSAGKDHGKNITLSA